MIIILLRDTPGLSPHACAVTIESPVGIQDGGYSHKLAHRFYHIQWTTNEVGYFETIPIACVENLRRLRSHEIVSLNEFRMYLLDSRQPTMI